MGSRRHSVRITVHGVQRCFTFIFLFPLLLWQYACCFVLFFVVYFLCFIFIFILFCVFSSICQVIAMAVKQSDRSARFADFAFFGR